MSLLLAPYNNVMRLGQGFNSYTQQICVDDAVFVDPDRAENVVTNDGTTMRIMAQSAAKPSAWTRQKETVADMRASGTIQSSSETDSDAERSTKTVSASKDTSIQIKSKALEPRSDKQVESAQKTTSTANHTPDTVSEEECTEKDSKGESCKKTTVSDKKEGSGGVSKAADSKNEEERKEPMAVKVVSQTEGTASRSVELKDSRAAPARKPTT